MKVWGGLMWGGGAVRGSAELWCWERALSAHPWRELSQVGRFDLRK